MTDLKFYGGILIAYGALVVLARIFFEQSRK